MKSRKIFLISAVMAWGFGGNLSVVEAESLFAVTEGADPSGGAVANAINDVSRLAWNTMLAVPAAGNSVAYEFDVATGLPRRVKGSLGPLFTSRAYTLGKGRFSVGSSVAYFNMEQVDGIDFRNGEHIIPFSTPFGPAASQSIIESKNLVTQISFSYGLRDNLDISVGLPVLSIDNHTDDTLLLGGIPVSQSETNGNATGLADILVRSKWVFLKRDRWLMAADLSTWLPTGNERNSAGIEEFRIEPALVFSTKNLPINLNVNLSINTGTGDRISDEFRYKVGIDWGGIDRLTLFGEILGRQILDNERVLVTTSTLTNPVLTDSRYTDAATGIKWNPIGDIVVYAAAIVGLDNTGLRDPLTGTVGLEFNF